MPAKHGLIIGIDRYSTFEEQYQLSGCVNDAKLIKRVLVDQFNFDPAGIIELHDAEASQQGILDAMVQLADRVARDDVVVFHFSGHGRQRTSTSDDEGIGLDSTITPSDSGAVDPYPNLDITDNVIGEWIERLTEKTPYITLIFDCCHSGTITRDASSAKIRGLPPDRRALPFPPVRALGGRSGVRSADGGKTTSVTPAHVVMSGCRDDEYSHEYCFEQGEQTVRSGALTHFLTRALLRARPGATYRDVFEVARRGVNTQFPQQHPQIEGLQDREIFGVREFEPIRFIPVTAVDGDRVTLGGGAAHGLEVGSTWTAHAPGTKHIENRAGIGSIRVTRVDALSAAGRLVDGGPVDIGARCVEAAPSDDRFVLRVALPDSDREADRALDQRVAASPLVTGVGTLDAGDLQVRLLRPETGEADLGAAPESVDAPCWEIVDRSGALAFPTMACSSPDAVERMVTNLEAIARFRNALALDHPDSTIDADFNIYRVDEEGELEEANGGGFTFDEGDRLAFEIVNRSDRKLFVSVLDFGLTGRISLVYPQNRAGEMVAAGKTVRHGVGDQHLKLGVPAGFQGAIGTESLKAFISTEEADFRWLQQSGTRSADSGCAALRRWFDAAYHGPRTRDIAAVESSAGDDEDWTAPTRSFRLRRARQ